MLVRNPIRCIPSASRSMRLGNVTLGAATPGVDAAGVAPTPLPGNATAAGALVGPTVAPASAQLWGTDIPLSDAAWPTLAAAPTPPRLPASPRPAPRPPSGRAPNAPKPPDSVNSSAPRKSRPTPMTSNPTPPPSSATRPTPSSPNPMVSSMRPRSAPLVAAARPPSAPPAPAVLPAAFPVAPVRLASMLVGVETAEVAADAPVPSATWSNPPVVEPGPDRPCKVCGAEDSDDDTLCAWLPTVAAAACATAAFWAPEPAGLVADLGGVMGVNTEAVAEFAAYPYMAAASCAHISP